ncbi:PH domain-containing protein [Virgibacillus flavescens]|uniref:PH domain-containing protein n=1 Tax=Virgibacillus flavescens TaxID=1611422 RepID=UPI003D354FAD
MRQPPVNTIADEALKAWKLTAVIFMSILWLLILAGLVLSVIFDISFLYAGIGILLGLLIHYLFVYLLPKVRWNRWRYEIFEQEIYIQHGIIIVSRTLVPMIRVQHVDTKQGPILKKYQLAGVTISTAATTHEIPALREEDAAGLRDRISALARVDEDDV